MTISEQTILERLERLERLFEETRLPDDAIVGADYVARMFDCSPAAVVRGRFGTDKIPRVRVKPLGFRKRDVHAVLREKTRPVADLAALARSQARIVKRK